MNLTRDRLHSFGWAVCLIVCGALFAALTFRVNAVKSQVRLAERQIVALEQEKTLLETEFETRANQHQLAQLEPTSSSATPRRPPGNSSRTSASSPVRQPARAPERPSRSASPALDRRRRAAAIPKLVSPLTGKPIDEEAARARRRRVDLSSRPLEAARCASRCGRDRRSAANERTDRLDAGFAPSRIALVDVRRRRC